jgi:hypothetical protein
MTRALKLLFLLGLCFVCIADKPVSASSASNGWLPSVLLTGGSKQAFTNNRPLSLNVQRFSTFFVARSGPHKAEIRVGSSSAKSITALVHNDGSLFPNDTKACGFLDSLNFVAVVAHSAPNDLNADSTWTVVIPIQFVDCSNASVKVTVSVARVAGNRMLLRMESKRGGPIRYEGGESSEHLIFEGWIDLVGGRLIECDATAVEDLDSVEGHSSWMLIPLSAPE